MCAVPPVWVAMSETDWRPLHGWGGGGDSGDGLGTWQWEGSSVPQACLSVLQFT